MDEDHRQERFVTLFDEHVTGILGYALRRVAGPADAADVVAETFLVAWRRLDDVPSGGEARPWLFGVARRVLANQRRGQRRQQALADRLRSRLTVELGADPADVAVTGRQGHKVHAALAQLAQPDREVLQLTAWEGLTPTEIARVLDVPPATVRTRLHRARARLRSLLEDEREPESGHVERGGDLPVATEAQR